MTKIRITEDEKLKRQNQWSNPNLSSEPHPLTEESAGDDECDVDGVTAHNDPVKPFEYASTGSSSCWIHGEMRESFYLLLICVLGFAQSSKWQPIQQNQRQQLRIKSTNKIEKKKAERFFLGKIIPFPIGWGTRRGREPNRNGSGLRLCGEVVEKVRKIACFRILI